MKNLSKINKGYTLIETMIAISLFVVVVTISMGALLNASVLNQKSRDVRSILDNLNYIMEDMSRNLRTGSHYHCFNSPTELVNNISAGKSCPLGGIGVAFESGDVNTPLNNADQWVYKFEPPATGQPYDIFKSTSSGVSGSWVKLNSDEIMIDSVSSFLVIGAEAPPDTQQPFITIKLIGRIVNKDTTTPFSIQTSISQRSLDI